MVQAEAAGLCTRRNQVESHRNSEAPVCLVFLCLGMSRPISEVHCSRCSHANTAAGLEPKTKNRHTDVSMSHGHGHVKAAKAASLAALSRASFKVWQTIATGGEDSPAHSGVEQTRNRWRFSRIKEKPGRAMLETGNVRC